MPRFIFQSPIINRDGLYSHQPLSIEQARLWLNEGADPVFRLPLIASVIQTLTGRVLPHRPAERCYLHTGDEALVVRFDFPELRYTPGYQRGQVALRARALSLAEIHESVRFGLLRKFARLDPYVQSIVQWDAAFRHRRWRYLAHDAVLANYGLYHFGRIDADGAVAWLDEGPYESQLRYDATRKALELFVDDEVLLWDSSGRASFSLVPGDQVLIAFLHTPGERPRPFEPYTEELSSVYARDHTSLSLLTRLSDDLVERNVSAFPTALSRPGEVHGGNTSPLEQGRCL